MVHVATNFGVIEAESILWMTVSQVMTCCQCSSLVNLFVRKTALVKSTVNLQLVQQ